VIETIGVTQVGTIRPVLSWDVRGRPKLHRMSALSTLPELDLPSKRWGRSICGGWIRVLTFDKPGFTISLCRRCWSRGGYATVTATNVEIEHPEQLTISDSG